MRLDIVQQFTNEANLVFSEGEVWLCHASGHRVNLGSFFKAMAKVRKALGWSRFRFMLLFVMVSHFNRSHSLSTINAVRLLVMDHMQNIEA